MLGYVCSYTVYSYTYTTMYSSMVCIVLTRQYDVIVTAAWPVGPSAWPVGNCFFICVPCDVTRVYTLTYMTTITPAIV